MAQKSTFITLTAKAICLITLFMTTVFCLNCDIYKETVDLYEAPLRKLTEETMRLGEQSSESYVVEINKLRIGMRAKNRAAFVPSGWEIIASAEGDLDGDDIDDYALVIQSKDLRLRQVDSKSNLNFNPRVMLILLTDDSGESYTLVGKSNKNFLPTKNNKDALCLADPLNNYIRWIIIKNGKIEINLNYLYDNSIINCDALNKKGNTSDRFIFKYQNDKIELIWLERKRFISGDQLDISIDFSQEKVKVDVESNGVKSSEEYKITDKWEIDTEEFYNLANCHDARELANQFADASYGSLKERIVATLKSNKAKAETQPTPQASIPSTPNVGGSGILTDSRDGKRYKTVVIGGNRWMGENLNYQPQSGNSWCYDNNSSNCNKYGRLYDLDAARTVCPSGFHLPSRGEWKNLVDAAGGKNAAGKKLKARSGWNNKGNGTDDFGFSALPGGYRDFAGSFDNVGYGGTWWTATGTNYGDAYSRDMRYGNDYVGEDDDIKNNGFSVRCIQD